MTTKVMIMPRAGSGDPKQTSLPDWVAQKPAGQPPPGQVSNLINPPTQAGWDILTQALCFAIVSILFILRFYTKASIVKSFNWEDWLYIPAFLFFIAFGSISLYADMAGHGRDLWNISIGKVETVQFTFYLLTVLYGPAACFIKVSLQLLCLRVFHTLRPARIFFLVNIPLTILVHIGTLVLDGFLCTPIEKLWKPFLDGRCLDSHTIQILAGSGSLAANIVLVLVPLACTILLKRRLASRLSLAVIFAFGAVACAANAVRLDLLVRAGYNADGFHQSFAIKMLTTAELAAALIASALTAMPALLRTVPCFNKSRSRRTGAAATAVSLPSAQSSPASQYGFRDTHAHPLDAGMNWTAARTTDHTGPAPKRDSWLADTLGGASEKDRVKRIELSSSRHVDVRINAKM